MVPVTVLVAMGAEPGTGIAAAEVSKAATMRAPE